MFWERVWIFVLVGSGKWKSDTKDESVISGFCGMVSVWDWCFRGWLLAVIILRDYSSDSSNIDII